jgi:tRNA threonylcarbamoyladenosine biosynthesis protein TsaE
MAEFTAQTRSEEETRELGRKIGAQLPERAIILLNGELGSGKTWFTKGLYLGRGGEDADLVVSPSYTLVHLYEGADAPFYHVDLYRLEDPRHLLGLEYEEFLYFTRGTSVIEWPRGVPELLEDDEALRIDFNRGEDESCDRTIVVSGPAARYANLFAEFSSSC